MKFSVASIVTLVALFYQASAASVLHCGGPDDLTCPNGLTCCGPLVDAVGTCVPGTPDVCKVPINVQSQPAQNNCGGANGAKCGSNVAGAQAAGAQAAGAQAKGH